MPVFHTIEPKDIWLGDHLYIWRLGLYQHHGIVLFVKKDDPDASRVLEFNTDDGSHKPWRARIQEVSLKQFRGSSKLKRVVYNSRFAPWKLAGTAYRKESLSPEHVVDNAQLLLEQLKFGGGLWVPNDPTGAALNYHLLLRNCECLAFWCKTGQWISEQVEKIIHWVGSGLSALIKWLVEYLIQKEVLVAVCQEFFSEVIENAMPSLSETCCNILHAELLGNALALIILEVLKLIWRAYQNHRGQMTYSEFKERAVKSLINALTTGVLATAFQGFLLAISGGAAAPLGFLAAGLVGSVLGPMVGNFFTQYLLDKKHLSVDNSEVTGERRNTH